MSDAFPARDSAGRWHLIYAFHAAASGGPSSAGDAGAAGPIETFYRTRQGERVTPAAPGVYVLHAAEGKIHVTAVEPEAT